MKILFYSTKTFEVPYLKKAQGGDMESVFTEMPLGMDTATQSKGFDAVSVFTSDDVSARVVQQLFGIRYLVVRAAGFDNVDLEAAARAGIRVANAPDYSPHSIAEHAVALMLALSRRLVLADTKVRDNNFLLDDLVGFEFKGKMAGLAGTGRIGSALAAILHGFGCRLLAFDRQPDRSLEEKFHVEYTSLERLCEACEIICIQLPLTPKTWHLFDRELIGSMRAGVMLINTARGAIVDTQAVIEALEAGKIGYYGTDVYEFEQGLFFFDRTGSERDPILQRLISHPRVLVTPHQAFATREALNNIATTTYQNLLELSQGGACGNELLPSPDRSQVRRSESVRREIL